MIKLITREQEEKLKYELTNSNKILVLYGSRQVGKTTLVKKVLDNYKGKILSINADQQPYLEVLSSRDLEKLKGLVADYDLLFIDEAQRVNDIGINLKILHDSLPNLKIIVTGSSSLDLSNRIKEPLTGRTWTFHLYPVSINEWKNHFDVNPFELKRKLEEWLIFGMYPEGILIENRKRKIQYLRELTSSYLYKDILALGNIKYPEKLGQLLKLLSYQTGNLVSINELSNSLKIHRDAVTNYINLLEKSFVIFRLGGFSRNLRKEIVKMDKIYFYDLGIRNALIENFNSIEFRNDIGQLWENFLISERIKRMEYQQFYANKYFWRTHTGAELDYIEETGGQLNGYEFKWKPSKKKAPSTWLDTYENATYQLIHRDNFLDFIL